MVLEALRSIYGDSVGYNRDAELITVGFGPKTIYVNLLGINNKYSCVVETPGDPTSFEDVGTKNIEELLSFVGLLSGSNK